MFYIHDDDTLATTWGVLATDFVVANRRVLVTTDFVIANEHPRQYL
jgi:hypothetical protein